MTSRSKRPITPGKGEQSYLVLYWDYDHWVDDGSVFKTIDEAKDEIKGIVESFDDGVINPDDFVIILNDGKSQEAFRPLDFGDYIYNGKAKGNLEDVIIARGYAR